jgi:hypothetical protein
MIQTSSARALGWGMALFLPGVVVAVFFFVSGLPSVGFLGSFVAIAGWICLTLGVTDLASKTDALYERNGPV